MLDVLEIGWLCLDTQLSLSERQMVLWLSFVCLFLSYTVKYEVSYKVSYSSAKNCEPTSCKRQTFTVSRLLAAF